MKLQPGLTTIENMNVDALVKQAKEEGRATYVLPGTEIRSSQSFFEAIRAALPLDPPIVGSRSWDALSDSLWGGLDSLDATRVLILWPNSSAMRRSAPDDYELAASVLADVATSLGDPNATDGNPKEVSVLLG
jgi:hypothetical protein